MSIIEFVCVVGGRVKITVNIRCTKFQINLPTSSSPKLKANDSPKFKILRYSKVTRYLALIIGMLNGRRVIRKGRYRYTAENEQRRISLFSG